MRWTPFDIPSSSSGAVDFVQGLHTVCGAGDTKGRHGIAIHVYMCNTSMVDKYVYQDLYSNDKSVLKTYHHNSIFFFGITIFKEYYPIYSRREY